MIERTPKPIGGWKSKRHHLLAAIRAEVATTGTAGATAIRLYTENRCVSYAAFMEAVNEGAAIYRKTQETGDHA